MSVIQRVIILNKPFKIRGYTIWQWVLMGVGLALAILIGTRIPQQWKLGNLPFGFVVGMIIFCGSLAYVMASQMKPMVWWRNKFLYTFGFVPRVYLPKQEEAQEYPDSSIKEPVKREDESYVAVEHFDEEGNSIRGPADYR